MSEPLLLVINPGSTSTKMALFFGTEMYRERVVRHDPAILGHFDNVADQFEHRMEAINDLLETTDAPLDELKVVVGRGAPLKPLEGGSYAISDQMLDDLKTARYLNHASNLGGVIARHLGERYKVPCLISDPVSVDNFPDIARVSGVPGIERKCRSHALNIKEVARREAAAVGKKLEECNFAVAHMGGGISVAALEGGRIVDVNNGMLGMGPYSPERAGALPIGDVIDLCFSGEYTKKELEQKLARGSGLLGYLGQADLREVESMIEAGDGRALLYFQAMAYQIAKEIGGVATVLKGEFEAIILTGGMAHSKRLIDEICARVRFLSRVAVVAGEFEMEALAAAGVRYLTGEEQLKEY